MTTVYAQLIDESGQPYTAGGASESTPTPENADYVRGSFSEQGGDIFAAGQTVLSAFDAQDFQSVSIQVSGTFTGTIVFEVSNDGANWIGKSLSTSNGGAAASATGPQVFYADLGARYIRARATALTGGTATLTALFSAFSVAPPILPNVGLNSPANLPPNVGEQLESAANLAANATYAGAARDMGTTVATRATRIRPVVMHVAGVVPGHLVLETSTDAATWRETRRVPVPSDGQYHSFDWPLHLRYYRLRFINGTVAQTGFYLTAIRVNGEGSTIDTEANLTFVHGNAVAIAASASLIGDTLDLGFNHSWNTVRALFAADQVGGQLRIEHSLDGTNWFLDGTASASYATASTALVIEGRIASRFVRARYQNGATAVTAARLTASIVSV